eukprot:9749974-Alexandrium_andersonii.AAC.1
MLSGSLCEIGPYMRWIRALAKAKAAEIRLGIKLAGHSKRRQQIQQWQEELRRRRLDSVAFQ